MILFYRRLAATFSRRKTPQGRLQLRGGRVFPFFALPPSSFLPSSPSSEVFFVFCFFCCRQPQRETEQVSAVEAEPVLS